MTLIMQGKTLEVNNDMNSNRIAEIEVDSR